MSSNGTVVNLYLLTQTANRDYHTFDSCVVAAHTTEEAQRISPAYNHVWSDEGWRDAKSGDLIPKGYGTYPWAHPSEVKVRFLGVATASVRAGEVLCSSYNPA